MAQSQRKTVGVLVTDAKLFGGFDQMTMSPTRNQPIIDELEKQYDVKQVNPEQPITEKYDVLLAVQPSSLGPEQMEHFIAAVEAWPTDGHLRRPVPDGPERAWHVAAPKRPQQQDMFGGGGRPQGGPRGTSPGSGRIWASTSRADQVVWQRYNPYPRLGYLPDECVFVDQGASKDMVFNPNDPITSGLQEMIFLFPGHMKGLNATQLADQAVGRDGREYRLRRHQRHDDAQFLRRPRRLESRAAIRFRRARICHWPSTFRGRSRTTCRCRTKLRKPPKPREAGKAPEAVAEAKPAERKVNVVLVSDIDVMYADFFELRNQAGDPNRGDMSLSPDNVTFVLNVLDSLAGDDRFIEIRKRRRRIARWKRSTCVTAGARQQALELREKYTKEFETGQGPGSEGIRRRDQEDRKQRTRSATESHPSGDGSVPRASAACRSSWTGCRRTWTSRPRRSIATWPCRSARCRTGTRCGPCSCRRFSRCWWALPSSSVVVPANAKAWPAAAYVNPQTTPSRGRQPRISSTTINRSFH